MLAVETALLMAWGVGQMCQVTVDFGPSISGIAPYEKNPPAIPPPPVPPKLGPPSPVTRIRVHGLVQEMNLQKKILPQFPKDACSNSISGTVHLLVTVAKDGSVREAKTNTGDSRLVRAAQSAIKQWRYRPTLVNGHRVEVVTDVYVRFLLSPNDARD